MQYTSFSGTAYELSSWVGRNVAILVPTGTIADPAVMTKLLAAFDGGYDYYRSITGREPADWPPTTLNGRSTIAIVDETCGAGCGYLGFRGIEILPDWFGSNLQGNLPAERGFYDAMAQTSSTTSIVFYELGRNFWFYGDQLGDYGFATGYAVVNRHYARESAQVPLDAADGSSDYHNDHLPVIAASYFGSVAASAQNTGQNQGIPNATGFMGSADLAASLLRIFHDHAGPEAYAQFWRHLETAPIVSVAKDAFDNFTSSARQVSRLDFGFLFKDGWTFIIGSGASEALSARALANSRQAVLGFSGNDTLNGSSYEDTLLGDLGDDKLYGGAGDDQLLGGLGADSLKGDAGVDTIYGGGGSDTLDGGLGDDLISGGLGNDTFLGGKGTDELDGGGGEDTVVFSGTRADHAVVVLATGLRVTHTVTETTYLLSGMEYFQFEDGALSSSQLLTPAQPPDIKPEPPVIRTPILVSTDFALPENVLNVIATGRANIKLTGNAHDNSIRGNVGNNIINGWAGADKVDGGYGNDNLTGGSGKDAFLFTAKLGTSTTDRKVNFDTIKDFVVKDDSIYLDNAIFKKLGSGTAAKPKLLSSKFFSLDKAKDANDYVIYNKKTGVLSYDADGTGKGQAVEFALLKNKAALKVYDFFVI